MTETESRPRNRALVASFLFTDLVGYSKGTASEQYAAKATLSEILGRNLAALDKDDYRIKDTGDGALIAFLSNPEHALYMALAIAHDFARAASASGLPSSNVRTGLHIGAVKEAIDLEARPNFVGDGINAAQRIMDFAAPGQITASRAYFEAVSWLDAAYAALFQHLGASNDKHGRPHELYAIAPSDAVLEKLRLELGGAEQDPRDAGKAAAPLADKPLDRATVAVDGSSAADAKAAGKRRPLVPVAVLAGVAILAGVVLVLHLNPPGDTPRSAGGNSGAGVPSAAPPAQPVAATTIERASVSKSSDTPSQSAQDPTISATPATQPASDARSSTSGRADLKSSVSAAGVSEPTPPAAPKQDAATATHSATDANAPAAKTMPSARMNAPSAAAETQRKAAEPPAGSVASSPSAPTGTSAAASARCRHILEKVQLGEPLSQDEKRELASSCR